jgi:DNA-binding MarR family transcriptional regulator
MNLKQEIQDYYSWWRRMNFLYHSWAEEHGVSPYTLFVLSALTDCARMDLKEGCTQKQICEEWFLPKQTVNSILKGLEQKGYLKSTASVKDGRRKLLFLTPQGEAYAFSIIGELSDLEERVMEKMGEEGRARMNQSAHLFCDLFEEEGKKKK